MTVDRFQASEGHAPTYTLESSPWDRVEDERPGDQWEEVNVMAPFLVRDRMAVVRQRTQG